MRLLDCVVPGWPGRRKRLDDGALATDLAAARFDGIRPEDEAILAGVGRIAAAFA